MAKEPKCKDCGGVGHYAIACRKTPRNPIRSRSVKPKTVKGKSTKKKPKTRSWYVKELDRVFSIWYRQSQADKNGNVECYTCRKVMHWKEIQTGHFFTRARQATRWDEANVRPQDYRCNVALNGNYITFTRKMLSEIGKEALDELEYQSLNGEKISTPDLRELIEYYKKHLT